MASTSQLRASGARGWLRTVFSTLFTVSGDAARRCALVVLLRGTQAHRFRGIPRYSSVQIQRHYFRLWLLVVEVVYTSLGVCMHVECAVQ